MRTVFELTIRSLEFLQERVLNFTNDVWAGDSIDIILLLSIVAKLTQKRQEYCSTVVRGKDAWLAKVVAERG